MFDHAIALESVLCSPERATAPDTNGVLESSNGVIMHLGWLRQLARDVRKVAEHLEHQEPKATAGEYGAVHTGSGSLGALMGERPQYTINANPQA
jgi:hypothetical protein